MLLNFLNISINTLTILGNYYICLMQLSVIILNYNVRYFLQLCLQSVQKALEGIESEIIVVDNNSPDDSCKMVAELFPQVKLIALQENFGFPKGNNIGVQEAKGKYICILNPDTVVAEDTFTKMLTFAEGKDNFGIAGAKMIDGTGRFLPESKRGVPTPWVAITKIAGFYKLFPKVKFFNRYYAMHLGKDEVGETQILTGAFMFMHRETYLNAGGFDESYFMYSEDMDLSYTVLKAGKKNWYYPGTAIIHYKGESTVRDTAYMKRFNDATKAFYRKHFNGSLFFDLFMRAGTLFFVFSKKNKKVARRQPEEYYLFSRNEELKLALEEQLTKKIIRIGEYKENMLYPATGINPKQTEIIFDNDLLTYGDIIAIMQRHCTGCYTFKIKPQHYNFIIGSNSSNDRGAIIHL